LEISALKAWKDLDLSPEGKAFSGTVTYTATFDAGQLQSDATYMLDLGRVEMIASVTLNGQKLRTLWTPPYQLDVSSALHSGENMLQIEVTGTWFNRLVYDANQPENERKTWVISGPAKNRELRESGLLGPVVLQVRSDKEPSDVVKIHSHNDYTRTTPFYQAYSQQVASIEADIYATDNEGELLVAHDLKDLPQAPTLDEAYILPLVNLFNLNYGRAWRNSNKRLVLLIDLKTSPTPTLDRLVEKLKQYPEVFDSSVNPLAVSVVISGDMPDASKFDEYPQFISFDGQKTDYTQAQLERIYMVSRSFGEFSRWNGSGKIADSELVKIKQMIETAHSQGKPMRFWGCPDNENAWQTFHQLGVDYINTDRPEACTEFFRN